MTTHLNPSTQHFCYDNALNQLVNLPRPNPLTSDFPQLTDFGLEVCKLQEALMVHDDSTCDRFSPALKSAVDVLLKRYRCIWVDKSAEINAVNKTRASLNRQQRDTMPDLQLVHHCYMNIKSSITDFDRILKKSLGYFDNNRIIFYTNDDGAERIGGILSQASVPYTHIKEGASLAKRHRRLRIFKSMPSVLIVSGDNVTVYELHGIPVDAVFQYYPSRSKHSRKVPEGIVDYEEQTKALCRFGHKGLSLVFVQDKEVRHAVMDLSIENYAVYGTPFEELDTKGQGGSLVQTLDAYLS